MSESMYVLLGIGIASVVTILLRALPFWLLNGKKTPEIISYLGTVLPYAIMAMLVVYCLKGVSFSSLEGYMPSLLATVLVVVLHVYKRNTLLSIVGGTIAYMFLVQVVF